MEKIKVASLFCGCGGMDLGVIGGFSYLNKEYGVNPFEIVYAVDNDEYCTKIYNNNFNHKCIVKDVRDIIIDEIPDFDLLIGGFPCQSFSISAQNPPRLGYKDERGMLFFEMVKILKARQPRFFIAENVKGILSANKGKAFPMIMHEFREAGYTVIHKLLLASDFGVPQKRERVIIVGFKNKDDYNRFHYPSKIKNTDRKVLGDVIMEESNNDESLFFSEKAVAGMLAVREKMNKGRVMSLSEPCNTISAHLSKVSLNSTDPVYMVGDRYRRFSTREAARIQSFPDSFILNSVSPIRQYKAIGNAVPPVMMWHIANSLQASINSSGCESKIQLKEALFAEKEDPIQLTLFEPTSLYYSNKDNILIGSCRQGNKKWIIDNQKYNYPVTDMEIRQNPQLLKVKHILIKHKKSIVGYYNVQNICIVNRKQLKELCYPIGSSMHKADSKYILYDLAKSETEQPIIDFYDFKPIIGKGVV